MTHYKSRRLMMPAIIVAVATMAIPAITQANTIVYDTFTASKVTAVPGSTPDTGPAGATWLQNGYAGYQDNYTGGTATLGADAGNGISLSGVTATSLTLSDSFNLTNDSNSGQNANYSANSGHGAGLGFYSSVQATSHAWNNFTGLRVTANGYIVLATSSGNTVNTDTDLASSQVSTSSSFGTTTHTLSYTVNIGATSNWLSNIILDGNNVTGDLTLTSITNPFTTAASRYFGFYNSTTGYQSNVTGAYETVGLSTAAVPEPASLGILAVGAAGLLLAGRRKLRV